jgi:hypothetical protein
MKRLKELCLTLGILGLVAAPFAFTASASAALDLQGGVTCGTNGDVSGTGTCATVQGNPGKSVSDILALVINILSVIVGFIAVIMIIVAGIRYITSGGESSNVATAKNTIIYAVIGLVIVVFAQILVHFVLKQTSNVGK